MKLPEVKLPGDGAAFERFVKLMRTERERHMRKWGSRAHSLEKWIAIIAEEFGEFVQAANDHRIGAFGAGLTPILEELVSTAACCSACFEETLEPGIENSKSVVLHCTH